MDLFVKIIRETIVKGMGVIMQQLFDVFAHIGGILVEIRIRDVFDIALVSFIVYKAFKIARETRAEQLLKGIALLLVAYFSAKIFDLKTMKFLLGTVMSNGILAIVILFQPELRRTLEKVGRSKVSNVFSIADKSPTGQWNTAIPIVVEAVDRLSRTQTGALIVLEQKTKLGEQIATGVEMNAVPSVELFGNIFFVNTPLHDGAVIMRDGKILAAACFLPKPQKEELIASHLGSRHRASIGISEVSDALTIVVSEETGTVSIAENGELSRGFSRDRLTEFLTKRLAPDPHEDRKNAKDKIKNIISKD